MPATIQILSLHGSTGASSTQVDGSTIKYKKSDDDTNDANNPIPIPGAGFAYSYPKNFRLNATVGPANSISNVKFYTDGANGMGTGVSLLAKASASYVDPTANAGGSEVATMTDAFTYTSGSPLAVSGSLAAAGTGQFGDYVVTQLKVASTASAGNTGTEVLTFSYDES